jgi:hypothetical protein
MDTKSTSVSAKQRPEYFDGSLAALRKSKETNFSQQRLDELTSHLLKLEPHCGEAYFTKNALAIWRHAANFVLRYRVSKEISKAKERIRAKCSRRIRFGASVKLNPAGAIEKGVANMLKKQQAEASSCIDGAEAS